MNTEERLLEELKNLLRQEELLRIKLFKSKGITSVERAAALKQLNEIELQKKVKGQTLFRDLVVCSLSERYSVMVYVADQRPLLNLATHDWFIRSNDGEWTMEIHQEPTWAGVKVVKKIVGYSPIEWAASYTDFGDEYYDVVGYCVEPSKKKDGSLDLSKWLLITETKKDSRFKVRYYETQNAALKAARVACRLLGIPQD